MRPLLVFVALSCLLLAATFASYGQTTGALLPNIPPAFTSAAGIAASAARLCAFAAGTTTPLAIYSDSALTTTLPNPNTLDAIGRPTTSGGTAAAIYIQPRNYKFILYAAGATGSACPLTGTTIWSRDNVYDAALLPNFDNIRICDRYPGATAGAKLAAAYADLPATGGFLDCRGFEGAQTMTSQLLITKSNVTFMFGCSTWTLSGVTPSGTTLANFQISGASNVWFQGLNRCTVLKLASGETSNIFSWRAGGTGGGVSGIELDGNKANNTSGADDTFQSGVGIFQTTASGATANSNVTVENCAIHDFNHYGIQTYGEYSNANVFRENLIYSNGKNDANGTGDGIYINYASQYNDIVGNRVYLNQRSGIRLSALSSAVAAADNTATGNRVVKNWTYSNTVSGIKADEQSNLGSGINANQAKLLISGNVTYSNTENGIHLVTVDNVGNITNAVIEGNHGFSNVYGLLIQSNAAPSTSNTRQTTVIGNHFTGNSNTGIFIGTGVLDTLIDGNVLTGNSSAALTDNGTRTRAGCNVTEVTNGMCSVPIMMTNTGALQPSAFSVFGSVALSGGAATVTFTNGAVFGASTNYVCSFNDLTTAGNAVTGTHTSASQLDIAGTGTDTIAYHCVGLK